MFSWFFGNYQKDDQSKDITPSITPGKSYPEDSSVTSPISNVGNLSIPLIYNCCHGGYTDFKRADLTSVDSNKLVVFIEYTPNTVIRDFYTNIMPDDIESVQVLYEDIEIDSIKGQWIEALCLIYNIEEYTKKGLTSIPMLINGAPLLKCFSLRFIITLKTRTMENYSRSLYYNTYDSTIPVQNNTSYDDIKIMLYDPVKNGLYVNFRTKEDTIFDSKTRRLRNCHYVFYFFMNDPNIETVELEIMFDPAFDPSYKFETKRIILKRKFKTDKWSVFPLVKYLKDFENSINFDMCSVTMINQTVATELVFVNSCVHRYSNGWFTHNEIK
jgi:hypothetical protein